MESWTQGKSSIWKTNQAAETKEKKACYFMGSNDKIYEKKTLANLFLKTLP